MTWQLPITRLLTSESHGVIFWAAGGCLRVMNHGATLFDGWQRWENPIKLEGLVCLRTKRGADGSLNQFVLAVAGRKRTK